MCPLEENPIILSSGGMALGNLPPTAAKCLLKKKNSTKFIGYHIRFSSTTLGKPKSGASFRKLEVVLRYWSLAVRRHMRERANLRDQFVCDPLEVKFVQGELCRTSHV